MKVLFIGNSHTYYNDMPLIFQTLCARAGTAVDVCMLTRGGVGLDDHYKNAQSRFNILFGGYDCVVLQHCAHPMGEESDMIAGAAGLHAFIAQANARCVLYETWAAKGDEAYQSTMSGRYERLAARLGAELAPVGDAWQIAQTADSALDLFAEDGRHASAAGSLLAAHVLCRVVTGAFAPALDACERALVAAAQEACQRLAL